MIKKADGSVAVTSTPNQDNPLMDVADDQGMVEPMIEDNNDDEEGPETESVNEDPISYVENIKTV